MKKLITICLCVFSITTLAQQTEPQGQQKQPSPEDVKKIMEMSMGAMIPVMVRMTDGMIQVMLLRAEDPETARKIARFKKNLYDALIKEGFQPDQAMAIMQNTSMPSATPAIK